MPRAGPAGLALIAAAAASVLCVRVGSVSADGALGVAGAIAQRNVAVAMRDGVVLRADVYRPAAQGRFPTLVYRTPYGKDDAVDEYATFRRAVGRGYAVVVQDVRGRYHSDGTFDAYRQEGPDGYDTIEWSAAQPWSDGRVGTFGLSYPGAVQWLAALERPPHLLAMVPAMTFSTPRNFVYAGGAFDLSWPVWIWFNIAPDLRVRGNIPGPRSQEEASRAWPDVAEGILGRLPLRGLPELRTLTPFYDEWLSHTPQDAYWDYAELRGRYDRVTAAVLGLSGWHDETYGAEGAVTNFLGLRAAHRDMKPELMLGPWIHGVDSTGETRAGDRDFGAAAAIDYDAVVLDFLDRHVRAAAALAPDPVRVFVMGADEWRGWDAWPPPESRPRTLYLAPPDTDAVCGALTGEAPVEEGAARFRSDPDHPLVDPYADDGFGAHDYRALAGRPDTACFETAPLTAPLEVIGPVEADVAASADARDFDLWLKLLDVGPDGTAWNLLSPGPDVERASLAGGARQSIEPDQRVVLRYRRLLTANRFQAGHRLRVVFTGSFAPHFSRNLQTGRWEAESAQTRAATIAIRFGGGDPSRLVLRVLPVGQ